MPSQPENPKLYRTSPNTRAHLAISARKSLPAYLPLGLILPGLVLAAMLGNFFRDQDVSEYQCYAVTFWYGPEALQAIPASQCDFISYVVQFHSLPLEYPPLALAVYSLPLPGPLADYPFRFTLVMALTVSLIYLLLLKHGPPRAATFFAVGLLAGGLATSLTRFDMFPAALSLVCLLLAERKRWTWAYAALALGVLIKIYPLVLFPLLFLAEQHEHGSLFHPQAVTPRKTALNLIFEAIRNIRRWHWKNTLVFAGMVAGVTAISWGLSPSEAFAWLSHLYLRPFAAESTGAALLWLASLAGNPITWNTSFGSLNVLSTIAGALSEGLVLVLVAGYIHIVIQQLREKMSFFQACVAALMLLIVTGKVFSPQYLLWLMPFMAISAPGNRRVWLAWMGICLLTTLIYPVYYGIITISPAGPHTAGFMPVILLRNGLLAALTIAYLFNIAHWREGDVLRPTRPA